MKSPAKAVHPYQFTTDDNKYDWSLEELEEWVGRVPVDVDLGEHVELNGVLASKLLNDSLF